MRDAFQLTWNVTLGLLLMGLYVLLYQIIKLQGRLLLRLDEMDQARTPPGAGPGLEVGTPISEFRLPDLDGRMVSSGDLLGRRVLLVHWGPGCGFCELLAPDLARIHGDLTARGVRLVLASREDAEANRGLAKEHGLECPILLMEDDGPLARGAFLHQGTPVAYLLDEGGRVARPLAVGGDAILALAGEVVGGEVVGEKPGRKRLPGERPLSESRIERDGLKAGTPAPAFRLPELRGEMVELEDYRGRGVLLIFTDPHCGPCEELAPHLARLQHRCRDGDLQLIMVARGDVDENRRKADAHGFEFPVVIQDRWKLSREYGIFAVPVAFLIGEDGVIAKNVARGVDEILALVPQGLAARRTLNARSVEG
jgi:peroxiredoxin